MAAASSPWRLTLDAVSAFPRPGANVPSALAFSPDSRLLTFLFSERGDLIRDLWAMDVTTGERRLLAAAPGEGTTDQTANPEEALRRERQRLREGGITHYRWAKGADRLLVPVNGRLYVTSSIGEPLWLIAPGAAPAVDARLTPDGRRVVVFVRGRELWVVEVDGGEPRQLTFDARETVTNGLAEFIAQEEMGRDSGFWIAPDGQSVAFAQVDDGQIPVYPIVHQGDAAWRVEEHRYPFAGAQNAHVRLGVVALGSSETHWLELGADPDVYLARVDWRPDGRLLAQIESRDQRRLELRLYDVASGDFRTLFEEAAEPWLNLHNDLRFTGARGDFLWSSERDGFRHLYWYDAQGGLQRQLTSGDWPVDSLLHVDDQRASAYFLAGRESPLERQLYRVSLLGGEPMRLTEEGGFHSALFSPDGNWYVDAYESRTKAPSLRLYALNGGEHRQVHAGAVTTDLLSELPPPELVTLEARDGTRLYGAIYHPLRGSSPSTLPPAIVSVYGGPHAQMVTDTWGMTVDLRAQYLARQGFLVFKLDNRGSARRGLAFEAAIHRRLGKLEVQDQVDGVRWLTAQRLIDPQRVGLYGWSYGGYLTLMCLMTEPELFKSGVAGAPVVDWDGYDTHYTERYMETPATNAEGYRAASALTYAEQLAGNLLMVHGMIDENVHFRHSARLIIALESSGRQFDLLVFPGERHMPRSQAGRRYLEERVAEFFRNHL